MTTDYQESEAGAIIDVAQEATEPHLLTLGGYYIARGAGGTVEHIDLTGDEHRDHPKRIEGATSVDDVASLLALWDKHAETYSEAYADRRQRTITAIFDAHHPAFVAVGGVVPTEPDERARWQSHRAVLTLHLSDPLKAWLDGDNKLVGQETFAEFVEDHMPDIADPEAADLLEMVQSIHATARAEMKSGFKLVNGQRQFTYLEQIEATTTTRAGTLELPTNFTLALPVWRWDTDRQEITARLRYRVDGGHLKIGYKLDRPKEIIDAGFAVAVAQVAAHIGQLVLLGTPVAGG